ncbi:MAG: FGGY-family carbohydrate kinase [Gammaproteobacteria bacterium]|nr:FGGY-family carbohydrate kinase [Gammaproteobacteria bacterium]
MKLFIGIDIGTSGIRAVAINTAGQTCADATTSLPAPRRAAAVSEQDALIWWRSVLGVLKVLIQQVPEHEICSIAIDATSGTLLAIDSTGMPLSPALMYNDSRAQHEAQLIRSVAPVNSAVHSATSGLAKWIWLKNHQTNTDYRVVHQADWIAGKLCGRFDITDKNNALKTGYDPINNQWPDWLTSLDIEFSTLPAVVESGTVIAPLLPEISKQLGLDENVMVVSGTTDSTASFIATGCHKPGQAVTSLGSTLVLKVISSTPVFSPEHGVYSHPLGQHWLVGGSSNSGGAVLKHFFDDAQIETMTPQLQPQQPTGLDYYPLIQKGERFPHNDPDFAERLSPRPDDDVLFFQGMLEGIARIEQVGYRLLETLGAPYPSQVLTTGGGSNNIAWTEIRKNLLRIPVAKAKHQQAAYGAALLALKGTDI